MRKRVPGSLSPGAREPVTSSPEISASMTPGVPPRVSSFALKGRFPSLADQGGRTVEGGPLRGRFCVLAGARSHIQSSAASGLRSRPSRCGGSDLSL